MQSTDSKLTADDTECNLFVVCRHLPKYLRIMTMHGTMRSLRSSHDNKPTRRRVSVGIFATAGVFATIKCVIYVDVHNLCNLHVFFRFCRCPRATTWVQYRLPSYFLCNNQQNFKICNVDVISRITKTKIFSNVNDIQCNTLLLSD